MVSWVGGWLVGWVGGLIVCVKPGWQEPCSLYMTRLDTVTSFSHG